MCLNCITLYICAFHSSVNGPLGCFCVLKVYCYEHWGACIFSSRIFVFSRYIPRSEIAESYGSSLFSFF